KGRRRGAGGERARNCPMNLLSATVQSAPASARLLRRTLLLAVALDRNGLASHAARRPCRTAGARFTVARVQGRARLRAESAAGAQTVVHDSSVRIPAIPIR